MSDKIKVIIIDDHPLMRRGIRQLLELQNAFDVVGDAGSGTEGIHLALQTSPDLVILDLNMKRLIRVGYVKSAAYGRGGCAYSDFNRFRCEK